ncbi:hypothetical protein [Bradyrhizobium betae]|uniref:Glycosyl transferase family 2 n=1 Tax=Bradyrhizobium betae TaxID=244734 RepID=A0A5P6PBI0_9BRAD|nr:hypothetical protein [Bradyrhizobium betae]MCS3731649.1 hypothetical protein [Bradyrhizobium betae]QFI75650.1 hypothetical protein F8237_26565 [Bradyrhizobium betae]
MIAILSSVTVVIVVRHVTFEQRLFDRLIETLHDRFHDVETVIVANGVSADESVRIKTAAETIPDCTVLFLSEEVHDDVARLLGIDHSISDYVLFATPLQSQIDALPAMIVPLHQGNDVVIGESEGGVMSARGTISATLFDAFRGLYRLLAGVPYEAQSPTFRIFSRAAALYIANRRDGEVLVRARSLAQGFPSVIVPVEDSTRVPVPSVSPRIAVAKALRLILTGSATPLRLTAYLGFGGGIVAVLYGTYAIMVFFFQKNVEPGWTTLSLLLSAMMFVFSAQFLFLSEYLVQILSAVPSSSRRQLVAREFRGPLTSRAGRLNVVDSAGEFQLGAAGLAGYVEKRS